MHIDRANNDLTGRLIVSNQMKELIVQLHNEASRGQLDIMVNTEGKLLIFARVLSGHFANFSLAIVLVITTLGHSDGGHQSCHETSAVFMLN